MDDVTYTSEFRSFLKQKPGPWQVVISETAFSDDSSCGDTTSEEEDEARQMEIFKQKEVPSEYWHIQKLLKFIKTGNETGTLIALCCLQEYDLTNEAYQYAIIDTNGLETLLNILETNEMECKLGALQILTILAEQVIIKRALINMGAILTLINNLNEPATDLQTLAAKCLAHLLRIRRARRIARTNKGIPHMMHLEVPQTVLETPLEKLSRKDKQLIPLAISMMDVWFCLGTASGSFLANSRKCRTVMRSCGFIFILAKYLKSVHIDAIISTMGTISICSEDKDYRQGLATTEGMVKDMVHHLLTTENLRIRRYTCRAIASSAKNKIISSMVRQYEALPNLMQLARNPDVLKCSKTLSAVTAAIWKLANNFENRQTFTELDGLRTMISLLSHEDHEIVTNAVGTVSELLKIKDNLPKFRALGGIPMVVDLMRNCIYEPLLENIPLVMKECADEDDSMVVIEQVDGIRLVWSLLSSKSKKIQANATWALVPLVANVKDSGEMVRNFTGGLELVLKLLKTDDHDVLAAACAALAVIGRDTENLNVLTDYKYVPQLAKLLKSKDINIQENLLDALATCCRLPQNRAKLGKLGVITSLASYLLSPEMKVQRAAAKALYELSKNSYNCVTMHESGITNFLLNCTRMEDVELQDAAAGCLSNMRNTVLQAETYHLINKGFEAVEDEEVPFDLSKT